MQSYINWGQMIVQVILSSSAYGGFSKPDQMVINFDDGSKKVIYRIGSRIEFKSAIAMVQSKL